MLVPIVIVFPDTPVVSFCEGHADVSTTDEDDGPPVPPLGDVSDGLAVERLPLHAAATSANTTTSTIATPERARRRWLARRRSIMDFPLGSRCRSERCGPCGAAPARTECTT